jgi:hypothetical protein
MYGKTNAMDAMVYESESYIGGSVKNGTLVSNEKIKRISDNKELFGAFMMLTVSAITMVYGMLAVTL